ncbi:hypothetical protein DPMN_021766 [Dreissena polymorpha]|uniref:Uncharacterized protein n=1 Tax=Dreissena polymorpha TaxID=45954 RepID=A0A9D4NMQ5_DREPO|nr:hypothetical protein DPMN_021766 [Dreissena polymorpha]
MKYSVLMKAKAVAQVSRLAGQIAKEAMRELAALNVQVTSESDEGYQPQTHGDTAKRPSTE